MVHTSATEENNGSDQQGIQYQVVSNEIQAAGRTIITEPTGEVIERYSFQ
jgi:hypothetical protein